MNENDIKLAGKKQNIDPRQCMWSGEIDDELSSMSGRNSGGGAAEGLNSTPAVW